MFGGPSGTLEEDPAMTRACARLLSIALLLAGPALATQSDGRGAALGGAYASLAAGAEGMWWNPAVLGDHKLASVSGGAGLEAGNNALGLADIAAISQADAGGYDAALKAIKDEGSWEARVQAGGGGAVAVWRVGVAWGPRAFVAA